MSDGLGDFFGGGSGGAPTISWDEVPVGSKWEGIILPVTDESGNEVSYRTTHASNIDQELLYWNPVKGAKPAQITDSHTDGKPNRPVTQAEITVQTEFRDYEFMSSSTRDRRKEDGEPDDGVRRTFVKGRSYSEGFREAMKALRLQKPPIGGTLGQALEQRKPIPGSKFKENIFTITLTAPTGETMAKVENYRATQAESGSSGGFGDDEPPF